MKEQNQNPTSSINDIYYNTSRFNFSELVVDFLGMLVPGLIFLFIFFVVVTGPLGLLVIQIKNVMITIGIAEGSIDNQSVFNRFLELSNEFWIEIGIFILIASYVVGHFFFRQDLKIPDKASYKRISREKDFNPSTWVVRKEKEDGSKNEPKVEYPYRYLKEYLLERNLMHLSNIVTWSGEDKRSHNKRTKFFINMLKIRLQFFYPDRCGAIRRNEGHIRLMSSVWFICKTLLKISIAGLGIVILSGGIALILNSSTVVHTIIPFAICISVILFTIWSKFTIEKYLHYMRVREILYVLETAYTANELNGKILKG